MRSCVRRHVPKKVPQRQSSWLVVHLLNNQPCTTRIIIVPSLLCNNVQSSGRQWLFMARRVMNLECYLESTLNHRSSSAVHAPRTLVCHTIYWPVYRGLSKCPVVLELLCCIHEKHVLGVTNGILSFKTFF